jgi:Ca-activated chloride channel homolog
MAKIPRTIRPALVILTSLFVCLTPDFARTQETAAEIPRIKVDVSLVTTEVTVLGAAGSELGAEDFVVYDNGVVQQVSHFSRDKLPLAVAVLIDRSSSIKPYLPILQKAAIAALGRLKPEDPVALFTFADDLLQLSDLTSDRNRTSATIGKLTIGSGTDVYEALFGVAAYLRRNAPRHRRAIILISDNCHTAPGRISGDDARMEVLESSVTLYSIKTPGNNYAATQRVRDPACHDSIVMVQQLADETGGQVLDVEASKSLQQALEKAISNLRLQYTLGFSPSDPGEEGSYHRLTVKLAAEERCPSCRLLARSGYYAGNSPQPLPNEIRMAALEPANKADRWTIRRKIEVAETMDIDLLDIPFAATTAKEDRAGGKPQVKINLQIDFTGIGFKTVGDRRTCTLHIAIFPSNEKREFLEPQFRTLEGMLREETYNQVLKAGMSISFAIPAVGQKQNFKIVLYDEIGEKFGSQKAHYP